MYMKRLLTVAGMLVATATGAAVPAISASAATAPAKHTYCVIKILPVPTSKARSSANHVYSRVVSRACSDQPSKVGYLSPNTSTASPAASIAIWTGYEYTNYKGSSVQFQGPDKCTANLSYPIYDSKPADNGAGNWGISSWHAWANCWNTEIFTETNFNGLEYNYAQGEFEAAQIGYPWDNHVWSVYTYY